MLINFPTATGPILATADAFLEKNHVDQAIVYLEEEMGKFTQPAPLEALQRKLLTCYLLKQDLEAASGLIFQLKQAGCLDLNLLAHHIIITKWQAPQEPMNGLMLAGQKELELAPGAMANLLSLTHDLKGFYEGIWEQRVEADFKQLFEARGLEARLAAFETLEQMEPGILWDRRGQLQSYLEGDAPRLYQTLLYLMLKDRLPLKEWGGQWAAPSGLVPFWETIASAVSLLEEKKLDINKEGALRQHLAMFYYSVFPHYSGIDAEAAINWLGQRLFGDGFCDNLEKNSINLAKSSGVKEKVDQYVQSLSL